MEWSMTSSRRCLISSGDDGVALSVVRQQVLHRRKIPDICGPEVDYVLALPEISVDVVVLVGERVHEGVAAGAARQDIVASFAAEDIVAVSTRQRVVEVAAKEPVVAVRPRLVDGARGPAVDHIGCAFGERENRRSHHDVAVSIAVDVAGASNRRPEMGGKIEPQIALTDGWAIDPEAIGGAEVGEIDIAKSGRLAEDDIGRSRVGLPVRVGAGRPDDQVGEAVAVEITCGGDRVSGFVSGGGAIDAEAVAGREVGWIDIRQAAGLAEDNVG